MRSKAAFSDSSRKEHDHSHDAHGHIHGVVDPSIFTTQKGIHAVKWSFLWLSATALFQVVIVLISGSVALLADTVHNIGDAFTAIPLWIAFTLVRRGPSRQYTYGYGRVEDLAGVVIVFTILTSAVIAGYQSIDRLLHPRAMEYLPMVAIASIIGFAGNEAVALFRLRVGKEIGSAALVADGHHARVDGLTSLAVLLGVAGAWLGYPMADPIVGLVITAVILHIVWTSGREVFKRLLDGVDPEIIEEIRHAVDNVQGVEDITDVRVRWIGHRLNAEVSIAVNPEYTIEQGHEIALEVRHQLLHHLKYLSHVSIHVDPANAAGERHHSIDNHSHDDISSHSH